MMVFKRKQIVVLSLVLMVVVAGYLQYSYKKGSISVSEGDEQRLGEAVYVDSDYEAAEVKNDGKTEDKSGKNNKQDEKSKDEKKDENKSNDENKNGKTKAVAASKMANDFFAQAKIDKEVSRGRDSDTMKTITEDPNASKEVVAKAYEKMTKLVENSDREMRIETLIKEKGFSDVLAMFADDGSVDLVVKAPNLTSAETAQIYDIISRHADIGIDKIRIKNIF